MLVDSHCHLDFPTLAAELPGVLSRARRAGVGHFLTIGTRLATFTATRVAAEDNPDVHCTIGVHPHDAKDEPLESPDALLKHAGDPKIVGFGESGLDYHYNHSPSPMQISNFRMHISAARTAGLPIVVHTRDAEADTIVVLTEEMGRGAFTGVFHCFSGTAKLARAALELGFYISASGIITFKKAGDLRAIFAEVPLDRLLIETDAPYLAPEPHRGQRNEPAFVAHTAEVLARVKGVEVSALASATTENFFRLFRKARP